MKIFFALIVCLLCATQSHAWGYASGSVEILYVNTYGNFSDANLNGGYCFKLAGFNYFFKVAYADSGEKRNNLQIVQSIVMAAYMSGKPVRATFVDWGEDASCRLNGAPQPAKWLENLQLLN